MNGKKDLSIRLAVFVFMPAFVPAVALPAGAVSHHVSTDESIPASIDNAHDGNEIAVAPGTYFNPPNFIGQKGWAYLEK